MCLLTICISSLEKCLFSFFAPHLLVFENKTQCLHKKIAEEINGSVCLCGWELQNCEGGARGGDQTSL